MLLSIGMMVKNEGKYLEACLNALKPILNSLDSELIIVDTGSTDGTVEIAKKYTDKVYFHKWNNNFSEMRNITLNYCTGNWFFCIDGDEILEDCEEIINFFNNQTYKKFNSAAIYIKNFVEIQDESKYGIFASMRLFKKDKDFKFVNAVHNQPLFKEPVTILKVNCKHYGYVNTDKELMERKYNRTVAILKSEIVKDPSNIYYLFQLGVSHAMHRDYKESVEFIQRAYDCMIEKKEDVNKYIYLFPQICSSYYNVEDYLQMEKYSNECLKYNKKLIDIYYYLGVSSMYLKKNDRAISGFESYLKLYENYYNSEKDMSVIDTTLCRINQVYYYLYLLNNDRKEYEKAKSYLLSITEDNYELEKNIVDLYLKTKEYDEIKKHEGNLIKEGNQYKINNLYTAIENSKLNLEKENVDLLVKLFSVGDSNYNKLNRIRLDFNNNKVIDVKFINEFIQEIDLSKQPAYFGDLIYYLLISKLDISNVLSNCEFHKMNDFIQYISLKYSDLYTVIYDYIEVYESNDDFASVRVNKELCRYAVFLNNQEKEKFEKIFLSYLDTGVKYVELVYTSFILENQRYQEARTEEDGFFIFMNRALKIKYNNEQLYVQYLRKSLNIYPYMREGIELLLGEFKSQLKNENTEMESLKAQLKNNIRKLIDKENIIEAKNLINEYKKIVKDDIEIYSIESVVFVLEENFEKAEDIIIKGLNIDSNNFDLNYNLAYIYEQKGELQNSLQYYQLAYLYSLDDTERKQIENTVESILKKIGINKEPSIYLKNEIFNKNSVKIVNSKILILCGFYSVFVKEFLENMKKKYDATYDILTGDDSYKNQVSKDVINAIYKYSTIEEIYSILNSVEKYDVIHIHFLTPYYSQLADIIRKKCKKLVVTIWGSDFYRTTKEQKDIQKSIIEKVDNISFDNEVTIEDFIKYYGEEYRSKTSITRMGIIVLEYLKKIEHIQKDQIKEELGIPRDSIVVTCGYNANPAHNHLNIIKSIKQLKNRLQQNMYYLFPMTYSIDESYVKSVENALLNSGLQYKILKNFRQNEEVAKHTKISDVMLQLQTTDTLSSSMLEHIYNGSIVITGKWLPYQPIKRMGAYFIEISSVSNAGSKLVDVVNNMILLKKKCEINKDIIWNFSAWENTIASWIKLYE